MVWSKFNRVIGLAIIVIAAYLFVPRFLSYSNVINLVRQTFLLTLIAYGMTLSMLIGGLDLSLGSVAALSSVLAATFISQGMSSWAFWWGWEWQRSADS